MTPPSRISAGIVVAVCMTAGASVVSAAPAEKTIVEDPINDANALNDQGNGDGSMGDNETPADASTVTDITALKFSNDAKNFYISIETEGPAQGTQGVGARVRVNPDGPGGTYCLVFEVFQPGAGNNLTKTEAHLRDTCTGETTEIDAIGNLLMIPRNINQALGKGAVLTAPQAHTFIYAGSSYPAGVPFPVMDTTKIGEDYKMVDKKKRKK
ncbi:MAG: hypothetical protein ACR2KQ_03725 [Actinomycetota bacterium]